MTTYKEIFGKYVKNYSSDPTADIEGQIWYNTTSGTFKSNINVGGAFASGPSLTNNQAYGAGVGTSTAAVIFGNAGSPGVITQKYNGTSWTASGNMNTSRHSLAGAGTQTAALASFGTGGVGGSTTTEEFNGSTWTSETSGSTGRRYLGGCGTQTAAASFGGVNPGGNSSATELYNGSTWTNSGAMNTARAVLGGCGTQTSALAAGGSLNSSITQEFTGGTQIVTRTVTGT